LPLLAAAVVLSVTLPIQPAEAATITDAPVVGTTGSTAPTTTPVDYPDLVASVSVSSTSWGAYFAYYTLTIKFSNVGRDSSAPTNARLAYTGWSSSETVNVAPLPPSASHTYTRTVTRNYWDCARFEA